MTYLLLALGWIFSILFGLLTISMLLLNNWLHALVLFLATLLCLPPFSSLLKNKFGLAIHPVLRLAIIVGLVLAFAGLFVGAKVTSIYKTPEVKAQFMKIYDEKMKEWPVPYEDVFVDTQYGKVHVIVSGPQDSPPMLLLHASGVSGWSWKYNVEELSQYYRTYAIDLITDAGKSEFTSLDHIMKDGKDMAILYAEITDQLGVEKAYVVGASEGGSIGTNYALYFPERVEKLALLGPMGYSGATKAIIRIMFTQFFPSRPVQDSTFRWAFSDNTQLNEDYSEWFHLIMSGINSVKVAPLPFSAEERQSLKVPVMFVFGKRDNLVGDAEKASALVQDVPDVRVEIVEAGHLMGGELPEECNRLILDFFGRP
jgi:pimeloyl-ACP methyl ester carboxylesterase